MIGKDLLTPSHSVAWVKPRDKLKIKITPWKCSNSQLHKQWWDGENTQ